MNKARRGNEKSKGVGRKVLAEHRAGLALLLMEVVIIIVYALFLNYGRDADPKAIKTKATHLAYYGMFQDVQTMLLIGFGFLMTFLRRYGYSSIGFNFLLCAVVMQWGLVCHAIFDGAGITVFSLIKSDVLVAAILISFGAVLGRVSPLQAVIMAAIESLFYVVNSYIGEQLKVSDPGGSIFVHVFGAYFGLAVSRVLGKTKQTALESSSYTSDLFSMIGTLFLWAFWPSFNGIMSVEDDQQRAIINTYISIAASCVTAFACSALTDPSRRFTMAHVQNATLAGGVAVGAVAEGVLHPYGAALLGALSGILSVLGFVHFQSWLEKRTGLHDSCGVNNLHGLPGVMSAVASAIVAAAATPSEYGNRLYILYKARAPVAFSPELRELQHNLIQVLPGEGRSANSQAGYQLLGLAITIAISALTGGLTGLILKLGRRFTGSVPEDFTHDDEIFWNLPEDERRGKRSQDIETISSNTLDVA